MCLYAIHIYTYTYAYVVIHKHIHVYIHTLGIINTYIHLNISINLWVCQSIVDLLQ